MITIYYKLIINDYKKSRRVRRARQLAFGSEIQQRKY